MPPHISAGGGRVVRDSGEFLVCAWESPPHVGAFERAAFSLMHIRFCENGFFSFAARTPAIPSLNSLQSNARSSSKLRR